ncbi:MAG: tRNA lysidine(34) synthetase TilS [Candidatus Solibacter usitatus]|nr:tRNA lysidine(34) synthetase TilS [Candidatus Solibacter usitatus]
MLQRVDENITRYSMFAAGHRVGVAVSGGADSVCLLHVLVELRERWNLVLSVLHLDHQLRGEESRNDAQFVADLARSLDLPLYADVIDIARFAAETGDNLEQAARRERRRVFGELLRAAKLDRVALGHTRSDQAETVLFRFLRGSGTAGLAGIRPVTEDGLVRPLLAVDRADVEQYLRERGIAWREDASNSSLAFARNRIRHQLLPELQRDWNPALVETLAHTADWAFEEEAWWAGEIERLAAIHLEIKPPAVYLRAQALEDLAPAAARRLTRRAIECVKGDLLGIDFSHVRQILALSVQQQGDGRLQVPGVDVFRSFEWLRLAPPGLDTLENRNYRYALAVPGSVALPGAGAVIEAEVIETKASTVAPDSGYNEEAWCLDWDRLSGPLEVRNWRPGDQYRPAGHLGDEKMKILFQRERIPLWERRSWPIITNHDEIVWARRFGAASHAAATPDSRNILRIREIPA